MEWLNYHHLLYFWLAAREGGITQAAKKLRLAQPTVSTQIRQLEAALGGPLFERQGRGLVPTELGQVVLRYADEIFTLGRELQDAVAGRPVGRRSELVVGISDALPKLMVLEFLKPALSLPEPVTMICREDTIERLTTELSAHRLDLLLTDAPLGAGMSVKAYNHLLGESGTTFFASPEIASRVAKGFPSSLEGAPFLLPGTGSAMRRALDAWLDLEGVRPSVVAELEDGALMKVFGQAGLGVFAAPTAIEQQIVRQYRVRVVGRVPALKERFYAISLERRIKHPGVLAISARAKQLLGAKRS